MNNSKLAPISRLQETIRKEQGGSYADESARAVILARLDGLNRLQSVCDADDTEVSECIAQCRAELINALPH